MRHRPDLPRAGALSLLLFLLLSGPAAADAARAQEPPPAAAARTIRVTGTGEVRVRPDQAHLDLAVETFAATAREAGEENAQVMDRVIRALVAAGVPREQIETRAYTLFPEYTPPVRPEQEPPRIRGYRASNMVTLRTTELPRIGELIDVALRAGANRMDAVRFSLREPEAAQAQALARAVERAQRSAQTMAAALGVRLGPVVEASTTADVVRPFAADFAARVAAEAAPPTPIEPGEQTVTATVALAFSIEGGS